MINIGLDTNKLKEVPAVSNEIARMTQLHAQGFHCSQIMIILGLERMGKSNPDLVKAMTGLAGGFGFCGKSCGALSGAICLLGLYAGRGELEEQENRFLNIMIQELIMWFEDIVGTEYGGINCQDITQGEPWNRLTRCPSIVNETYKKALELLESNGFIPVIE